MQQVTSSLTWRCTLKNYYEKYNSAGVHLRWNDSNLAYLEHDIDQRIKNQRTNRRTKAITMDPIW